MNRLFHPRISPRRDPLPGPPVWRPSFVTLLIIWTLGCGSESDFMRTTVVRDSAGIHIVESTPDDPSVPLRTLTLDPDWTSDPTLEFGNLTDVAPLEDGSVALLDALATRITLLDAEGSTLRHFGSEGRGPGEFHSAGLGSLIVTDSSLWVPDLQLSRISEFSYGGELWSTIPFPTGKSYVVDWTRVDAETVLFREVTLGGDRIQAWEGDEDVRTLFAIPPNASAEKVNLLLGPATVWAPASDGGILLGMSDRAEVESYSADALMSTTPSPYRIVRFDRGESAVDDAEREHLERLVLESARVDKMLEFSSDEASAILATVTVHDRRPRIAALRSRPDGTIWVLWAKPIPEMGREALAVARAGEWGGREWAILGSDGSLVDRVLLPEGFQVTRFHDPDGTAAGSVLYGVQTDELGVQRPARIHFTPRGQ